MQLLGYRTFMLTSNEILNNFQSACTNLLFHQQCMRVPVAQHPCQLLVQSCWVCCCYGCSVAKSRPTLCDPMNRHTPGSSVLHYLPEFASSRH